MRCFSRVLFASALTFCGIPLFSQEIPVAADRVVKIAEPVKTICWNRNDSLFALGESGSIIVRDAQSFDILHSLSFPQGMNLCFSREEGSGEKEYSDMILGVSSEYMAIWSLPQDAQDVRTDFSYLLSFGDGQEVVCAEFSRDSDRIAVAFSDGSAMVYFKLRYTQKLTTRKLEGEARNVYNLAFSPDSSLVVAASSDGVVRVWDAVDGTLISEIDSFVGMRTPVVFSADSKSIYACRQENVVSLISLDGRALREIRVRSTVSQFTVTSDDKMLIVLTDSGLIELYSMENGGLIGYIPPFNDSQLISFAFSSDYSQVLTGHEDGSVYKLRVADVLRKPDEPVPEMPDFGKGTGVVVAGQEHGGSEAGTGTGGTQSNQEPSSRSASDAQNGAGSSSVSRSQGQEASAPFEFRSALRERFHAFNVGASALMLDKKNTYYQFGTAVEFDWYTTHFTAPVYEGVGARFAVAFPADNYPVNYKTLDGSGSIAPPHLFFGELFVPVGVQVPLGSFVDFFSEAAFAFKVSWLMNPGVTSSKQEFSIGGRIRTGIIISKVAIMLGAEYDSMWGLVPEVSVMANFKLKGKGRRAKK